MAVPPFGCAAYIHAFSMHMALYMQLQAAEGQARWRGEHLHAPVGTGTHQAPRVAARGMHAKFMIVFP